MVWMIVVVVGKGTGWGTYGGFDWGGGGGIVENGK